MREKRERERENERGEERERKREKEREGTTYNVPIRRCTTVFVTRCSYTRNSRGFSPGAFLRLNTLSAWTCWIDLTDAAQNHGIPNSPHSPAKMPTIMRSKW